MTTEKKKTEKTEEKALTEIEKLVEGLGAEGKHDLAEAVESAAEILEIARRFAAASFSGTGIVFSPETLIAISNLILDQMPADEDEDN